MIKAIDQVVTDNYAIYHGDSCELIRAVPDNSVHYGIHSPPFEGLYKFTNSDRDVSNNEGADFWEHYNFLIGETLRVTMPGRLHSVHVMQLPATKGREGFIGMRDFRGDVIRLYQGNEAAEMHHAAMRLRRRAAMALRNDDATRCERLNFMASNLEQELRSHPGDSGWLLHSEVCIWKDPVVAQQRTKSIRLLHKQLCKDSALSGQGLADYIVTFRKPGVNEVAIAGGLERYVGDLVDVSREAYERDAATIRAEGREPWPFKQWVSIMTWQRYASPVWTDIRQTRTLQYRSAREEKDELHISPLQLDVIERCIELWSNPGETVLTQFMGIGSEVYVALEAGRRGLGFELKDSYFRQAVANIAKLPATPSRTEDVDYFDGLDGSEQSNVEEEADLFV